MRHQATPDGKAKFAWSLSNRIYKIPSKPTSKTPEGAIALAKCAANQIAARINYDDCSGASRAF